MSMVEDLNKEYFFDEEKRVWGRKNGPSFHYSDGDSTENQIRDILKTVSDKSVASDELKGKQISWPTTYYFSGSRSNLLRPFEKTLFKGARVLELGCGMGAITRYLGETAEEVWAVEGSERRGGIAAMRCEDLENVHVLIDDIMSLPESLGKFDVVTLIGVLEYARRYGGKDAENEILRKAASFLKPDGRLILAIENKLGLKYLAGVPEDHLGMRWVGLTNGYFENDVRTWSRKEILEKLRNAGFGKVEQFIALPDYKLPVTILTPLGLEQPEEKFNLGAIFSNSRRPFEEAARFNMGEAWKSIIQAGLVRDMSDSLCFVAQMREGENFEQGALMHHYGGSFAFADKYAKEIRLEKVDDKIVSKRRKLGKNREGGKEGVTQKLQDEPYYPGPILSDEIRQIVMRPNWSMEEIYQAFMPWILGLKKNMNAEGNCPGEFLDYMPFNLVYENGKWTPFDQEWISAEPIPFLHLIYRGLRHTFSRIWPMAQSSRHEMKTFNDIFNEFVKFLHLPPEWPTSPDYWRWQEQKFMNSIDPNTHHRMNNDFMLPYMNTRPRG